jgi:hypothetical protein
LDFRTPIKLFTNVLQKLTTSFRVQWPGLFAPRRLSGAPGHATRTLHREVCAMKSLFDHCAWSLQNLT